MVRMSLWYSIKGDVYHVCLNCKEGRKIGWTDTRKVTGGKKMCSNTDPKMSRLSGVDDECGGRTDPRDRGFVILASYFSSGKSGCCESYGPREGVVAARNRPDRDRWHSTHHS